MPSFETNQRSVRHGVQVIDTHWIIHLEAASRWKWSPCADPLSKTFGPLCPGPQSHPWRESNSRAECQAPCLVLAAVHSFAEIKSEDELNQLFPEAIFPVCPEGGDTLEGSMELLKKGLESGTVLIQFEVRDARADPRCPGRAVHL